MFYKILHTKQTLIFFKPTRGVAAPAAIHTHTVSPGGTVHYSPTLDSIPVHCHQKLTVQLKESSTWHITLVTPWQKYPPKQAMLEYSLRESRCQQCCHGNVTQPVT
jgi:hypothetical protein